MTTISNSSENSRYALPKKTTTTAQLMMMLAGCALAGPIMLLGGLATVEPLGIYAVIPTALILGASILVTISLLHRKRLNRMDSDIMAGLYLGAATCLGAYFCGIHSGLPADSKLSTYFSFSGIYVAAACVLIPLAASFLSIKFPNALRK